MRLSDMVILTWAQQRGGQKLHLVPMFADETVSSVALCGKHVNHWRLTSSVPFANACKNCTRVDRQNGVNRIEEIVKAILDS